MTQLSKELKDKVIAELKRVRELYEGTDYAFAMKYGLTSSAYSLLKNDRPLDGVITAMQWLTMGRELGIHANGKKWNTVRTEVFVQIEEEVLFCKKNSKSMILVDDCEIGKTHTATYLSKSIENCFYVDCSQAKTKRAFLLAFAKALGVDGTGHYLVLKDNVKYYLRQLTQPVIIVDEAGDLEYEAFLELKEFWNASDGHCGWYMMGADGLRAKIERGIANKKVGYREIFSRYSAKFRKVTPNEKQERLAFQRQLLTAVIAANCEDKKQVPELVKKCLANDGNGELGGLRRAESLLILSVKK